MMRFNSKQFEESLSPRVMKRRGKSHMAGAALAALAGQGAVGGLWSCSRWNNHHLPLPECAETLRSGKVPA